MSKGITYVSDHVTGPVSNSHQVNITIDSELAQKLAPSARMVAWYITDLWEIVSDSLDFKVTGAFANEV